MAAFFYAFLVFISPFFVTFYFSAGLTSVMNLKEFEHTVLPLRDKLFRMALRITRSREEAEDIVQDVMLKVWDLGAKWDTVINREAFCCTMTKNLSLSRISLKCKQEEELHENLTARPDADLPAEVVEKEESRLLLRRLIGGLPEKQRMVMELRDIEGMSYLEIARILLITEEQVKVNLFRARQEVKKLFLKIDGYGLHKN